MVMLVEKQEENFNVKLKEPLHEKVEKEFYDIGSDFCWLVATEAGNYWFRVEEDTYYKAPYFAEPPGYFLDPQVRDMVFYTCARALKKEIENSLNSDAEDLINNLIDRIRQDQKYDYYIYHGVFPGVEGKEYDQYILADLALDKVKQKIKSEEFTESPEFEDFYLALKEIRETEKKL